MQLAILDNDPQSRRQLISYLDLENYSILHESDSLPAFAQKLGGDSEANTLLLGLSPQSSTVYADLTTIRELLPEVEILVYTHELNERILFPAVQLGIRAFFMLEDSPENLGCALKAVNNKKAFLSPSAAAYFIAGLADCTFSMLEGKVINEFDFTQREKRVMELLLAGYSYKEIGVELHVSINTVRYYIKNIYRTLDVGSRKEMVRKIKSQ